MGVTGPVPKRSEERRRRNKTTESGESLEVTKVVVDEEELEKPPVNALPMNEEWHETAQEVYRSIMRSGQRIFMEPSDWAVAFTLCDQLSRHMFPQVIMGPEGAVLDGEGEPMMRVIPMPGSTLSAIVKGFGALGMTEGDRRRMRIELERGATGPTMPESGDGKVVDIRRNRLA